MSDQNRPEPKNEILTPEQVIQQYPNALFATERMQLVRRAQAKNLNVKVWYYDAVWGRTVLQMEVI